VSNADTEADVAWGDHEDDPPPSTSSQIGRSIKWKREAGYLLLGLVSLATVTGLYFWLDVPLVAARRNSPFPRVTNNTQCAMTMVSWPPYSARKASLLALAVLAGALTAAAPTVR